MINTNIFAITNTGKGSINDCTGEIVLQRQGCSKTVNAGCDLFFIEIAEWYDKSKFMWEVCYGSQKTWGYVLGGQRFKTGNSASFEQAKKEAITCINSLVKKARSQIEYHFCEFTQSYMYDFGIVYEYCKSDKIISPFYCLNNQVFNIKDELMAEWSGIENEQCNIVTVNDLEIAAIKKALSTGFHSYDYRKTGDRNIKRLAWLSGEYLKQFITDKNNYIKCMLLNNEMNKDK